MDEVLNLVAQLRAVRAEHKYVPGTRDLIEKAADELVRLRTLLMMAYDCLPDGDYATRLMASREIHDALIEAGEKHG